MKSLLAAAALLMTASAAHAAPMVECRMEGIERALGNLEAALKASPAFGHAGGHYAKALRDAQGARAMLVEGCEVWARDGMKVSARPARPLPLRAPEGLDPRCQVSAIEVRFREVEDRIIESPAYGHAAGHYGRAIEALLGAQRQIWEGCRAWSKGQR